MIWEKNQPPNTARAQQWRRQRGAELSGGSGDASGIEQCPDTRRRPHQRNERLELLQLLYEIEEYFWEKRGAHLLVSPLDWAIMEAWQKAGVAARSGSEGIDKAFESYQRSRRERGSR